MSLPGITVGISIYNKNELFLDSIYSVLRTSYKNFEVIICNDGSKDNTLEILLKEFEFVETELEYIEKIPTSKIKTIYKSKKYKNLILVDKLKNAGLSDSHNINVNLSSKPYYMTLDADSVMSRHTLSNFITAMFSSRNTVAVGGSVHIANGCTVKNGKVLNSNMPYTAVENLQVNEYLRSHVFGRTGWNHLGGAIGLSGTSSIFDKNVLFDVKGFDLNTFAHDLEIIIRIQCHAALYNRPYAVRFNPAVKVWTLVPSTMKAFIIQRNHWFRGTLKSILNYLPTALKLFPKKFSLRFLVFVYLEVLGVYIEFISYCLVITSVILGIISIKFTLLLFFIAWTYMLIMTIANHILDSLTFDAYGVNDPLWLVMLNVTLEFVGFRQIYIFTNVFATFHYFYNRYKGKPL